MTTKTVATPSPPVVAMSEDWQLIDDLLGGTKAMRRAGVRYLPRRGAEEPEDYDRRLSLATLYPALIDTVGAMVGRVIGQPADVAQVTPWIASEVLPDIDRQDRGLMQAVGDIFRRGLAYGLTHVLVEAPQVGRDITVAEQRAQRLRPYIITLDPRDVLGWRYAEDGTLAQVRIRSARSVENGWETEAVEQVRVYEPGRVSVWEKVANTEVWAVVEELATGITRIPLVTYYTGRTGPMTAVSPVLELAQLNAKHWRQQSCIDDLLEVASVPILALIGSESDDRLVIGGRYAVRLPREADLKYVEHSGAAIGSGREALAELKSEMRQFRGRMLDDSASAMTATQAREEAAESNAPLARMVRDLEDAIAAILDLFAAYRGEATGGRVRLAPDLSADLGSESMATLVQMHARGAISSETLFREGQRRGLIDGTLEWEVEQARIGSDGLSNGAA